MCKIMARFLKTSVSELVSCMALQYFILSHTSYILSVVYPFLVFWVSEGKNKHPSKTWKDLELTNQRCSHRSDSYSAGDTGIQ